jgi:hypothetical protein
MSRKVVFSFPERPQMRECSLAKDASQPVGAGRVFMSAFFYILLRAFVQLEFLAFLQFHEGLLPIGALA